MKTSVTEGEICVCVGDEERAAKLGFTLSVKCLRYTITLHNNNDAINFLETFSCYLLVSDDIISLEANPTLSKGASKPADSLRNFQSSKLRSFQKLSWNLL